MSYKLEQSIVPLPGTDTTVACDFEIGESSSKLSAFFPRKTKCTPASYEVCGYSLLSNVLNPIRPGGGGSEARMTKVTAANQKPLTL